MVAECAEKESSTLNCSAFNPTGKPLCGWFARLVQELILSVAKAFLALERLGGKSAHLRGNGPLTNRLQIRSGNGFCKIQELLELGAVIPALSVSRGCRALFFGIALNFG
jgi:hypothetical protein